MTLPSAAAKLDLIQHTCSTCMTTVTAESGDRLSPCMCEDARPSERTRIDVYGLIGDNPEGYKFYAVALPLGGRPVTAYDDRMEGAVGHVKTLLDVGWKG